MQISVKSDVDKALKSMRSLQRKQVPFAAVLGLTNAAKKVMKVDQRMMVRQWDRPTPFSVKGVRWLGANKADFKLSRLHSRVYLMSKQAEYLSFQIEGGTRTPKGTAFAVPTSNVKLNRYGNLAGGQGRIKRLLAKTQTWLAQPRWQWYDRSIRFEAGWWLTKAQRSTNHDMTSMA